MQQPDPTPTIFIGSTPQQPGGAAVKGEYVQFLGEPYYKIHNFDAMEPFFISVVSSSDHWLFISSTGGLSAGRGNADQALFPYYNVDRLTENFENTGAKALLLVTREGRTSLWEPFSMRQEGAYALERNLYKNESGSALVFEETNRDLGLTYRYAWRTSDRFGFVKSSWLLNTAAAACRVELLDGLQNLLPAHVLTNTQSAFSALLDAYKRAELDEASGLGIFALNSQLSDLAEPSESLLATTVAQVGLRPAAYLLSSNQLDGFRRGQGIQGETDIRGRRCAYFVHAVLDLAGGEERGWHLIADGMQDSAAIAERADWLQGDLAIQLRELEEDIAANQASLRKIVMAADGVQLSQSRPATAYHFANVLFNTMRGGIFADQYWIQAADFHDFVAVHNRPLLRSQAAFFAALPARIHFDQLLAQAQVSGSPDLARLTYAFMPLIFSRRHGDPSRPWNRFSINLKKADGSLKLDYEGNWRDIFQNWEALAFSYPEFCESMISIFLNATTPDGYNPYRITYQGLDWEVPEPGNPWANIGYWSDHQIIYLQKLMEISKELHPGRLQAFLGQALFSYAQVPYKLKPYQDLLKDPYNTIEFDWELEKQIKARQESMGTDGKLVQSAGGVLQVSLAEKLITLLLAKLANLVPEGGIWMNTQRPEWNDANNALVGKGLSVVTLCYLRRYIDFCLQLFRECPGASLPLNALVQQFTAQMSAILARFQPLLRGSFSDEQRRSMMDQLGEAGSAYRWELYQHGFSAQVVEEEVARIIHLFELAQQVIEHSLRVNRRADDLYHSYNILHLDEGRAAVTPLYEMLEGQVAMLSSGLLDARESLALLRSLRSSRLYVADRQTYILYPDRNPPAFRVKNSLSEDQAGGIALVKRLVEKNEHALLRRDLHGQYHFNGKIRNIRDVNRILETLRKDPAYAPLVEADGARIRALFEETFHHDEFTGRSGTFFAYEGLGSIYWHMVAKLLLAVQETVLRFQHTPARAELLSIYQDVRKGLGFTQPPDEYGAFPSDPYSHTPKGQGAKQPGMTGMVKEIILTRLGELGVAVRAGCLTFDPFLLDRSELLAAPQSFDYLNVAGQMESLEVQSGALAFTFCQVPVILQQGGENALIAYMADGSTVRAAGAALDAGTTRHIFLRDGQVHHLLVTFAG